MTCVSLCRRRRDRHDAARAGCQCRQRTGCRRARACAYNGIIRAGIARTAIHSQRFAIAGRGLDCAGAAGARRGAERRAAFIRRAHYHCACANRARRYGDCARHRRERAG